MIDENLDFMVVNSAFPHIGLKLKFFWSNPEFNSYIADLLYDTRGGSRSGFESDVLKAIFSLSLEHEREFPQLKHQQSSIWNFKR